MNEREEAALEAFFEQFAESARERLAEETDGDGFRRCWELVRSGPCFDEVMRMRAVLADESLEAGECLAAARRIAERAGYSEREDFLLF